VRVSSLAAVLLLAACSSGPTTSERASVSPSAAPSLPATPGLEVRLVGSDPVLEATVLEGKSAALPGAFVIVDGTYHAFLVGFGAERGDQRPYHATSPDGVTWTVADADPLAELGLELFPPGTIPTSVLVEADGGWTMYLWGVTDPSGFRSSIWRATATDPAGPWVAGPDPVLRGDPEGWDSLGVDFPSVVRTDDGYLMAFVGADLADRNTAHIGVATSPDGIAWTKHDGPVISPGLCGDFDDRSVTQPRLFRTAEGYILLYSGNGLTRNDAAIGVATSTDGVAWTCAGSAPLLDRPDVPASEGIHTIAVATIDDQPRLLIESLIGGAGGSELWLADLVEAGP
jgi:hypothetical protein